MSNENLESMTVGGGCFWCIEAIFQQINGVEKVVSGYTGGNVPGIPTYREVCSGRTGHAEVVNVSFDNKVISYKELLLIFMTSHNPTIVNKQGADVGSQYRSVIFYHDNLQKEVAETVYNEVSSYYDKPVVTEISPLQIFHSAEDRHQDYYNRNSGAGYCSAIIAPKLAKLRKQYTDYIKVTV